MKIYLDTNVFYFSLFPDDKRCKTAREILRKSIKEQFVAFTSSLTIDEFVWTVWKKSKNKEFAIQEGLKILKLKSIEIISIDKQIVLNSLKAMNAFSLKPRDAIHLAAMMSKGIKTMVSDDKDFDKIKGIKRKKLG